mgnify:FL=1
MTQADFAGYLLAQGGMNVGREYRIRIAKQLKKIEGKYATYEAEKPAGVFMQGHAKTYKSMRFEWLRVAASAVAVVFDLPRTGVNNCTEPSGEKVAPPWMREKFDLKNKIFSSDVDEFINDWKRRE